MNKISETHRRLINNSEVFRLVENNGDSGIAWNREISTRLIDLGISILSFYSRGSPLHPEQS